MLRMGSVITIATRSVVWYSFQNLHIFKHFEDKKKQIEIA